MVAAFDDFVELYVTSELFPLVWVIFVTYKLELASASVSSETKVPAPFVVSVTVLFAVTVSVSATAVGASFIPLIVMVIVAISVGDANDAPTAADNTVTTNEDTDHTSVSYTHLTLPTR